MGGSPGAALVRKYGNLQKKKPPKTYIAGDLQQGTRQNSKGCKKEQVHNPVLCEYHVWLQQASKVVWK